MHLISYIGTHTGYKGLANRLIRWRFGGKFFKDGEASHSELVFLPGDGVDHLMPDGTTEPDANGAVWCASSTATDIMPAWSKQRAGRLGGVRFKRIALDGTRWQQSVCHRDPVKAAQWFKDHEGDPYDWSQIFGFIFWIIAILTFWMTHGGRKTCSSSVAAALGSSRPDFYHPPLLRDIGNSEG